MACLVDPAPPAATLVVHGHRGCGGLLPENSLPAFRHAIALGVTTLELDVRLTRDGVLVVHHDPRLDPKRCVDEDGRRVKRRRLANLAYTDLIGVDCGRSVAGAHIPRLEEVLDLARHAGYSVRVSVELKMRVPRAQAGELARRLLAAIRQEPR